MISGEKIQQKRKTHLLLENNQETWKSSQKKNAPTELAKLKHNKVLYT